MNILDAIERYKQIHATYITDGITMDQAERELNKLNEDCKNAGIVFQPTLPQLEDHDIFEVSLQGRGSETEQSSDTYVDETEVMEEQSSEE